MLEIGAEAARRRLPELLDRANAGEQTIVKKRGVPYAAIVSLGQRKTSQRESLLSLLGTGKELLGKDSGSAMQQYRDEWE